jgi:hypothetical protein
LAATFFIRRTPFPSFLDDDQILSDDCGGNGRQIVRRRDISERRERRRLPINRGKPLLKEWGS